MSRLEVKRELENVKRGRLMCLNIILRYILYDILERVFRSNRWFVWGNYIREVFKLFLVLVYREFWVIGYKFYYIMMIIIFSIKYDVRMKFKRSFFILIFYF